MHFLNNQRYIRGNDFQITSENKTEDHFHLLDAAKEIQCLSVLNRSSELDVDDLSATSADCIAVDDIEEDVLSHDSYDGLERAIEILCLLFEYMT